MNDNIESNARPADVLKPEDWAGEQGVKWLTSLEPLEEMLAPIGAALLARADYRPGETVIDLGCGGGATTLAIAGQVGESGKVIGIDISPDLIAAARQRASDQSVANITWTCADAAAVALQDAPCDRLFSRFGSMFFEEPVNAFRHLHGLLRKHGRIDLAVWGPPRDNLWMMEMMGVVRNHVDIPPAVPRAPGPFAFEDRDYLRAILEDSGFSQTDIVAHEAMMPVGGLGATPESAVEFAIASMAVGRILRDQDEILVEAVSRDLAEMFARYHVRDQGILMPGKAWLVSAKA